jgi:3-hydroxy-9,10-secoandrosta-1,3,5(10)-triene-9,17-dione monooxygenase
MSLPQTREDVIERAKALMPALRERAARAEQLRRVPEETVRDFVDAGILRVGVPLKYGGAPVEYDVMFDVGMELGRACGASSWCYSLWVVHSWLVGHFAPEAQDEYFATGPDTLCSSSFAGRGKFARPVEGGYRVTGHWEFSSGCDAATWAELGVEMPDGSQAWALVPRRDYKIVDNWYVSGLSGSGSKDIVIEDAFVPSYRVLKPEDAEAYGTAFALHGTDCYHIPLRCLFGWDLLAPLVGVAQGCVDEFVRRTSLRGGISGRDSAMVQVRLALAASEVDAARALFLGDIREMLDKGRDGETITPLDRARWVRDKAFAAQLCLQAVDRLFDISGGHALFNTEAIQRFHRDAQAMAHRDVLTLDFAGQTYGKLALGGE